jgi:D-lactate dehydrogenase
LRGIVGRRHVLTRAGTTAPHAAGYRVGRGEVIAVVRPGSLIELWRSFNACVAAEHIVIPQAANTGLTGGSTPNGSYDRPVVVINTQRVRGIWPIKQGKQVICLAGATLYELEERLAPLGREPHSVIGSSCIGATVIGGLCNNSGGALVQRGPAYTQYALYAQVDVHGRVHLRNHLGIRLGVEPEEMLRTLGDGQFSDADIDCDARVASAAADYGDIVRGIDEPSAARFNADPRRLFEAAGSAGKVLVFAVRLDTFPAPERSTVFYVGTNDTGELTALRRRMLSNPAGLPISGEYIHRQAFDVAARYGKDTVLAIRWLGTRHLPLLFRLKALIDRCAAFIRILPANLSDRLLQKCSNLFPQHLPPRLREFRDKYEHHLILKVADTMTEATRTTLAQLFPSTSGEAFECNPAEAGAAMLHRFAVAGAAVRYRAVATDTVEDVVAVDVALRRDDRDWFERLPSELDDRLVAKLYYGHFFCHVFHQDYVLKKGVDAVAFEHRILELLDERGAEYPAEHNVGHLYRAKPALAAHYRELDPGNRMNPGLGGTSRCRNYA